MTEQPTLTPDPSLAPIRPRSRVPAAGLAWAATIGVLWAIVAVALFGVAGRDDPYITFSAAEAIRDSGALVNINGDPVEQSTSLLLTVALAAVSGLTGAPVPYVGWGASLLGLVLLIVLAFLALAPYLSVRRSILGAALVGGLPPLVYWSTSGAEQTWAVALTLLSIVLLDRCADPSAHRLLPALAGLVGLLAFAARPDAGLALLAGTALVGGALAIRRRWLLASRLLAAAGIQALLLALLTIGRMLVTGSPVPQPLIAKVGANLLDQVQRGTTYLVVHALTPWAVLLIVGIAVLAFLSRRRGWTVGQVLLLTVSLVSVAGLMLSGGDWMEAGRFWALPATLLMLLLLSLSRRLPRWGFLVGAIALLVLECMTLVLWAVRPQEYEIRGSPAWSRWTLEATGSTGVPDNLRNPYNTWNADHLGDAYFLGAALPVAEQLLAAHPGKTLTLTSGQGGMIPYYFRQEFGNRIRFIDRFQLMTSDFNDCVVDRGPYGAFVSWNVWEREAGRCAPSLPDLVYSIGEVPYDDLGDDYVVVVEVRGTAVRDGDELPQTQWLAVRRDLLQVATEPTP